MQKRIAVIAYIYRLKNDAPELLVFAHKGMPSVPLQVPGGGVEADEDLREALKREIEEESGLKDLELVRKLGVVEHEQPEQQRIVQRHFYLLKAKDSIADNWAHEVHGAGEDAGMIFSYFWVRAESVDLGRLGVFKTKRNAPELFLLKE
ncbi:MAG: NUDIX domain-containing protein [Bacteroidota bacterium]